MLDCFDGVHSRFDHDIVTRPVGIRPRLSITGNTRIDQLWVELAQGGVVHFILCQCAGEVVFHQDIAVFDEFVQHVHAGGMCKGQA